MGPFAFAVAGSLTIATLWFGVADAVPAEEEVAISSRSSAPCAGCLSQSGSANAAPMPADMHSTVATWGLVESGGCPVSCIGPLLACSFRVTIGMVGTIPPGGGAPPGATDQPVTATLTYTPLGQPPIVGSVSKKLSGPPIPGQVGGTHVETWEFDMPCGDGFSYTWSSGVGPFLAVSAVCSECK